MRISSNSPIGGWEAGNLGFDPISQTIPLTIDFRAVQLCVEDR
jgi:hypothetical protein